MNGFGKISHFRKHVREGLLVERRDYKNRCLFVKVNDLENNDIFHEYLNKES